MDRSGGFGKITDCDLGKSMGGHSGICAAACLHRQDFCFIGAGRPFDDMVLWKLANCIPPPNHAPLRNRCIHADVRLVVLRGRSQDTVILR